MLVYLIRKEILDQVTGLKFPILAAVGALAIWISLYSGYAFYAASLRDYGLAQAATEDRIAQLMTANEWAEVVDASPMVHKPPVSLGVFVRGLAPTLGRSIHVSEIGGLSNRFKLSPAEVEPMRGMSSPLDLGLVVQVVLSLFVLLLTYDAVCGEKEAGTLRLMTSFPVARYQVLLAKFFGVLIPTALAFGLPLLLGIAVLLQMPEVRFEPLEWERLGWILLVFAIYLIGFGCVGLLASCLTHRTSTAFVVSLVFWVATVAILPRLGLIIADGFRPAPSIHQYQAKRAKIATAVYGWRLDRGAQWEKDYLETTGREWRETPEGREGRYLEVSQSRQEAEAREQIEYARIDEAFRNRYRVRLDLAVTLARLSPAFALKKASLRLAGAGTDRQQRFINAFRVSSNKGT